MNVISTTRVSSLSILGFTALMAIACGAGCTDTEPETGTWTESGDEVLPPADDPEPWCGLEHSIESTDVPVFGEDWTNGHPFEVSGGVGYLDVVRYAEWTYLNVRIFDEHNVEHDYSLSARLVGYGYAYCDYHVHDVLVDGPRVRVLHAATCWSEDAQVQQRWVELSTIDVEYGLAATYGFWQLAQETYRLYQLALDGGDLLIGSYDVYSAELGVRIAHRQNGLYWIGDARTVSGPSPEWPFQRFVAFDAQDGQLTYRLTDGRSVRTTRYRACD